MKGNLLGLFALFLGLASASARAADTPPNQIESFAKLKDGDTLEVTIRRCGCFIVTSRVSTFIFRQGTNLTVTISEKHEEDNREMGVLTLTAEDIAGLDRMLNAYRRDEQRMAQAYSTIYNRIFFLLRRENKIFATDSFIESVPDMSSRDVNKVMLWSLRGRVPKE